MKKLGILVLAAALSSCTAGTTAVTGPRELPGISLAVTGAATSLDFTNVGGAAIPAALMDNVYETLVFIDEQGKIQPRLAESWEISDDGTTYTFQLKEGITFSNGDEFTADTAAFSIDFVQDKWTNGIASRMEPVASAKAIDKHTLEVQLEQRSNNWLWSMATATGAMMAPTGVDDLANSPVGTGPFEVSMFVPNEFVQLSTRADYWGENAERDVTIHYFPDGVSSVNALQSGSVDIVWALPAPELLADLPDDFNVEVGTTNGEVLLSMNNDTEPFNDPDIRRAVAYGIDRAAINDIMWDSLGTDTGGAPVPPTDPWFSQKDYYPYDPAKAKKLLAGRNPKITITSPTLPYAQTISEFLYSELTELGFQVTLETAEFPAVWLGQVMGAQDYDMSLIGHLEPRDIPAMFGDPDYYLGYDSERTRKLLAAADSSEGGQTPKMREAIDQIMADIPALTLMNMPNIVLSQPGIEGIQPNQVTDAMVLRELR